MAAFFDSSSILCVTSTAFASWKPNMKAKNSTNLSKRSHNIPEEGVGIAND